ncbi:amidohydrolase [Dendrosporobacter sp. 1207_IL3150]|uniref:amidohydrolase n=1 Tax=Dendrosporobacter sp. 1207_IL3150 TaxID=3084054 RepID=UPI002FDA95A1
MLVNKIIEIADKIREVTITRRRDLHRYPEAAWTEFRTAAFVADTLTLIGYQVQTGNQVLAEKEMMGVPNENELAKHMKRAIDQGANPEWINQMAGGKTGVVASFSFDKQGPVVALRFDMDANDTCEAEEERHYPYKAGFNSVNKDAMHACGHDGHISVGLAVAEILIELKDQLAGTIKLIFQPAEEGVRGAKAMVAQGIVDDVDYLLGAHLGFKAKQTGQLICNATGFLATNKYDAEFSGMPAHAGAAPETGKNALLAAACAALNLHAISRHGEGSSRINVGVLQAGSGRNVIPANALLKFETRGATSKINQYIVDEAIRVVRSAANMYDVDVKITRMGSAVGGNNSIELAEKLNEIAKRLEIFDDIIDTCDAGGSEDFSYFMERVQHNAGQACYMMIGAKLAAGHHDSYFDFDETALDLATKMLATSAVDLLTGQNKQCNP